MIGRPNEVPVRSLKFLKKITLRKASPLKYCGSLRQVPVRSTVFLANFDHF
jgi:hypothetical protein